MKDKTAVVLLVLFAMVSAGCTVALVIEANEISNIDLFIMALAVDVQEANSCAELQWESFEESRECLLEMVETKDERLYFEDGSSKVITLEEWNR